MKYKKFLATCEKGSISKMINVDPLNPIQAELMKFLEATGMFKFAEIKDLVQISKKDLMAIASWARHGIKMHNEWINEKADGRKEFFTPIPLSTIDDLLESVDESTTY